MAGAQAAGAQVAIFFFQSGQALVFSTSYIACTLSLPSMGHVSLRSSFEVESAGVG